MKTKNRQKTEIWKIALIVLTLALVVWGIFALLAELSKKDEGQKITENSQNTEDNAKDSNISGEKINDNDKNTDDKDQTSGSDVPTKPDLDQSSGLEIVNIMLTSVGKTSGGVYIEASGMVLNSTDSTGTCTYVFSGPNNKTMDLDAKPLPSASSMACSTVRQDISSFAKGKWTVKLKYKSDYSKGESSNELDFEIE